MKTECVTTPICIPDPSKGGCETWRHLVDPPKIILVNPSRHYTNLRAYVFHVRTSQEDVRTTDLILASAYCVACSHNSKSKFSILNSLTTIPINRTGEFSRSVE
eukprot:1187050-Prorocentrum_minimum.AAC.4